MHAEPADWLLWVPLKGTGCPTKRNAGDNITALVRYVVHFIPIIEEKSVQFIRMLQRGADAYRFLVCSAITLEQKDAKEIALCIKDQANLILAKDNSLYFAARISDNNSSEISTQLIVGWEAGMHCGITDYLS